MLDSITSFCWITFTITRVTAQSRYPQILTSSGFSHQRAAPLRVLDGDDLDGVFGGWSQAWKELSVVASYYFSDKYICCENGPVDSAYRIWWRSFGRRGVVGWAHVVLLPTPHRWCNILWCVWQVAARWRRWRWGWKMWNGGRWEPGPLVCLWRKISCQIKWLLSSVRSHTQNCMASSLYAGFNV